MSYNNSNNPQLQQWFQSVDTDRSGQICAEELQRALVNGDWTPFDIETIKLMIDMFDQDQSGTIGFNEFISLWQYIGEWQQCFRSFDKDNSNTIDIQELTTALRTFGFNLSDRIIRICLKKFNKHASKAQRKNMDPNVATFDTFIRLCVTLRMLTDSFRRFDNDNDGVIQIGYENFLDLFVNGK
ncbi:EF-hand [Neoconidiobolus thromboides FSU 785]|nr:EF-hand [Neoconidiobolus thromboides FSU 785]